jgi:glutamyl-tRNA reductase
VRSTTRLSKLPSIAVAAVHVARRALPQGLLGQVAVVLGAGVMARASAEALLEAGARVHVLNRTPARAEQILRHLTAVTVGGLDQLPHSLREATLVVGATASRQPILDVATTQAAMAQRQPGRPLLVVDIAVPRDVDARVRAIPGVTLLDLDDLERECPIDSSTREAEVAQAEALAVDEASRLEQWLRVRLASPAIAELRTFGEAIRQRELARSSARLRDLTPEQAAAVEALTTGIVNKLLHGPTVALRHAPRRSRLLRVLQPDQGRIA